VTSSPKIAFVSNPSPVIVNDEGHAYGPIRTNFFPHPQVTLASSLDQERYDASVLDLRTISSPEDWQSELDDAYAPPIQYGDVRLHRHVVGDLAGRVAETDADVDFYVMSANFTCEAGSVTSTMQALKAHNPNAKFLVGGRDAAAPERRRYYFEHGADFIGLGDADLSLPKFLDDWCRADLSGYQDAIIPEIPVPDSAIASADLGHISPIKHRFVESGGGSFLTSLAERGFAAYMETSRGCPRECSFCHEALTAKVNMPVDRILAQIDHYIDSGVGTFMFSDDNLLARKNGDLLQVFEYLRSRNVGWEFPVGVEVNLLTDGKGRLKKDLVDALFWNSGRHDDFAGLHRLLFPLEDSLLRHTHLRKLQKHTQELVLEELIAREVPFINITIMIGDPNETPTERSNLEANLKRIFELAKGTKTRLNFSVFCTMPLPETPFKDQIIAQNRLRYDIDQYPELWNIFCSVIQGKHFPPEETTQYRRDLLQEYGMQQVTGKVDPNY